MWRAVPGYEGRYEVSDCGLVRSLTRVHPKVLAPWVNQWGYPTVNLTDKDGRRTKCSVHLLVLAAFVGPRPSDAHEGCHDDGDPSNNRLGNLRWDTRKANQADRDRHGRRNSCKGSRNAAAKLCEEDVPVILARLSAGETARSIAADFGVSDTVVRLVKQGRTWQHAKRI